VLVVRGDRRVYAVSETKLRAVDDLAVAKIERRVHILHDVPDNPEPCSLLTVSLLKPSWRNVLTGSISAGKTAVFKAGSNKDQN
jgi:hypothetical protein